MKLIGVSFEVKIVDITSKMKSIVLGNDSVYPCYTSYILCYNIFIVFSTSYFDLVIPNIAA